MECLVGRIYLVINGLIIFCNCDILVVDYCYIFEFYEVFIRFVRIKDEVVICSFVFLFGDSCWFYCCIFLRIYVFCKGINIKGFVNDSFIVEFLDMEFVGIYGERSIILLVGFRKF